MLLHQVYAMVDGSGIVQCVSTFNNYEDANRITRAVYGDDAIAVDCLQYPCGLGDTFRDNRFWRIQEDGTEKEIEYVPTAEQQVVTLNRQLLETELALVEQYETNLALQEEVTNTQIAIAEFYEAGGAV